MVGLQRELRWAAEQRIRPSAVAAVGAGRWDPPEVGIGVATGADVEAVAAAAAGADVEAVFAVAAAAAVVGVVAAVVVAAAGSWILLPLDLEAPAGDGDALAGAPGTRPPLAAPGGTAGAL